MLQTSNVVWVAKESAKDQSLFFCSLFSPDAFTNTGHVPFCYLSSPDRHSSNSEIALPVNALKGYSFEKLIQVCVWPFGLLLLTVANKGQVCAVLKTRATWIMKVHVTCAHTHTHRRGMLKVPPLSSSPLPHLSDVRQRTSVPGG